MRETMSLILWNQLPAGFLKMNYKRWVRLGHAIQQLIVELASEQHFKCALCSEDQALEVDHDHDPEHGTGDVLTIYNIRGLACHRCNWHLMVYEKDQRG